MTHFKTFNKPTLYDEGIIVSASNSVEPTVDTESEIKRLKEELEKYKKAWSMVPDECDYWREKIGNGGMLHNHGIFKKEYIARECGLEVE